jgi:ubiquinol-cytochrome c reductase cytochrome b subunit
MRAGEKTRTRRLLDALDERLGLKGLQYSVPEHANKLAYSLGGLSLAAFVLLLGTGIVLAQFYNPSPEEAHASVRSLITDVSLGGFLRAFHYWMAMAMVVLVGLHLLRVFASGSFKRPREGNWVIGVVLVGLVAMFFFTGTVLKWDQEALEALEHNSEVAGLLGRFGFWFSPEFGGVPILTRLYTLHIAVLPAVFFLIVAAHLLLVKRHGMSPSPFRHGPEPEPTEPFSRHLGRLAGFALILVGVVVALAVLAPPVHGPAAVEGIEVTKPPWPLLWLYPIENWVGVSGILWATLAVFVALLVVPFVDRGPERHPRRRLAVVIPATLVAMTVLALIIWAAVTPVTEHLEG